MVQFYRQPNVKAFDWSNKIRTVCDSDGCALVATISVFDKLVGQLKPEDLNLVTQTPVEQLNTTFHADHSNGRIHIRLAFAQTWSEAGADLVIKGVTNQVKDALSEENSHGKLFGIMFQHSAVMYLTPAGYQLPGIVPHEFGHGLGANHAPNGSGSYMDYDFDNLQMNDQDIENLFNFYRSWPTHSTSPPPWESSQ
jgi:hypothetical protein